MKKRINKIIRNALLDAYVQFVWQLASWGVRPVIIRDTNDGDEPCYHGRRAVEAAQELFWSVKTPLEKKLAARCRSTVFEAGEKYFGALGPSGRAAADTVAKRIAREIREAIADKVRGVK